MADDQRVRSTRRAFLKGAAATGTGLAAAAYVKPNLRALGVPGALAQISDSPTGDTPVDSSVSVSTDPSNPGSSLPLLPSTGDGGATSALTESSTTDQADDNSRVPELMAVAVAGGLIGSRVVQTLRSYSGPGPDGPATDPSTE